MEEWPQIGSEADRWIIIVGGMYLALARSRPDLGELPLFCADVTLMIDTCAAVSRLFARPTPLAIEGHHVVLREEASAYG